MNNITANNINIDSSGNYVGGIIGRENLQSNLVKSYIEKIDITDVTVKGTDYVGGVMGSGKVSSVTLKKGNIFGGTYVGGICGDGITNICNLCIEDSTIKGIGNYIGGIVGYIYAGTNNTSFFGIVDSCVVEGISNNSKYVGGLAGMAYYGVRRARCV